MVSFHRDAQPVVFRADGTALERNAVAPAADGAPARELVGCGRGEGVRRLAIVDPASGAEQPEGAIGEIWASGPSIAGGYWNRPEESARTFHGALPGGNEGPFLRTGDLGFLHRGDLFVTGRLKDLIIIRGLNHYPQDIERTVEESHPALRPTAGAAFSVEAEGEEQLVVVHEIERAQRNADLDEVVAAIRRTVTESHEVEPYAVVLIRPASVLKTSSGKIQRSANRAAFLDGRLAVLHEWRRAARPAAAAVPVPEAPAANGARSEDEIASWLAARLARESGLDADELDLDQPFASFGLDSARALLLIGDLETWLGRRLSPVLLWNYPTVQALARHLGA